MANPKRIKVLRDRHLSTTAIYPKTIEQALPSGVQPVTPEPETYVPTGEEPVAQYITIGDTVYQVGGGGGGGIPTITLTNEQVQINPSRYLFTEEQYNTILTNEYIIIKLPSGARVPYLVRGNLNISPITLTTINKDSRNGFRVKGVVIDTTTYVGTSYETPVREPIYQHDIVLTNGGELGCFVRINSHRDTAYTITELKTYLSDKGFTSSSKPCVASGFGKAGSPLVEYDVYGIFVESSEIKARTYSRANNTWGKSLTFTSLENDTFSEI